MNKENASKGVRVPLAASLRPGACFKIFGLGVLFNWFTGLLVV